MKKVLIMPVLAIALLATACSEDGDPTEVVPTAGVRFFNATTGMTTNGGFTTNGQFVAGSTLASAQSTCSTVNAGPTSFGFGAAGSSGLTGSALATLNGQTITDGGNYIVAAAGSAASPQLFLIDNTFSGTLSTNQAAIRFVNLVPTGPSETPNNFAVFEGVFGVDAAFIAQNFAPGTTTIFRTIASGSQKFSMVRNHEEPPAVPERTFNLQAGGVYTIAVVSNGSGGFDLVPLARCN